MLQLQTNQHSSQAVVGAAAGAPKLQARGVPRVRGRRLVRLMRPRPGGFLLLGVGVPKDECFVSKGIAKRGWKEEESQIGAKDKMIV